MRAALGIAWFVAACALSGPASAADTLERLRAVLLGLPGQSPVGGSVERRLDIEVSEKPREQGAVSFSASMGPGGLRLSYPPELLAQALSERSDPDPNAPRGTVRTLDNINAADIAAAFNASAELLRDLEGASLVAERAEALDGVPATLLELAIPVRLADAERKRIRESAASLKLWLGPEGWPLASERRIDLKGRIMLIGFTVSERSQRRYVRRADRLIAVHEERHMRREGFGSYFNDQRITRIEPGRP